MKSHRLLAILVVVFVVAAGTIFVLSRPGPDGVKRPPGSIPTDCSRPVDVEINAFLASVPDGSTVQFKKNACYGQDLTITVSDRSGLTIDGNGATFKALTEHRGEKDPHVCRANWRIQAGSNITVKNMIVRGTNTTGFDGPKIPAPVSQCQHGFSFDSVQGGSLLNSKAFDVPADPVSIEPDIRKGDFCAVPPNRNILVDGFYGMNAGRTVAITNADGVTIRNSYFGDLYDSAVDLEADVRCEWMKDIHIINNRFGRYRFPMINVYTNLVEPDHMDTVEIRGNVSEAEPSTCWAAVRLSADPERPPRNLNVTIVGNDLKTLGDAIYADDIGSGSVIEGNTFRKNYGDGCTDPKQPNHVNTWAVNLVGTEDVRVGANNLVEGPLGGFASMLREAPA